MPLWAQESKWLPVAVSLSQPNSRLSFKQRDLFQSELKYFDLRLLLDSGTLFNFLKNPKGNSLSKESKKAFQFTLSSPDAKHVIQAKVLQIKDWIEIQYGTALLHIDALIQIQTESSKANYVVRFDGHSMQWFEEKSPDWAKDVFPIREEIITYPSRSLSHLIYSGLNGSLKTLSLEDDFFNKTQAAPDTLSIYGHGWISEKTNTAVDLHFYTPEDIALKFTQTISYLSDNIYELDLENFKIQRKKKPSIVSPPEDMLSPGFHMNSWGEARAMAFKRRHNAEEAARRIKILWQSLRNNLKQDPLNLFQNIEVIIISPKEWAQKGGFPEETAKVEYDEESRSITLKLRSFYNDEGAPAIPQSTLNQIDLLLRAKPGLFHIFSDRVRAKKGFIAMESALNTELAAVNDIMTHKTGALSGMHKEVEALYAKAFELTHILGNKDYCENELFESSLKHKNWGGVPNPYN